MNIRRNFSGTFINDCDIELYTMSSRSRADTKQPSYFLIHFIRDNDRLVVNRGKIKYDGVVKEGEIYRVQWGNATDIDDGRVLCTSSSWMELQKKKDVELDVADRPQIPAMPPKQTKKVKTKEIKQKVI